MKRLKRYFSLLLTVCLLCTVAPIATAANSGNERLYIPIVKQVLKESNSTYDNWTREGLNNGILYDLDDDGVDELILLHTSDRTDNSIDPVFYDGFYAVYDLYDVENGKLVTRFQNRKFGWHVDGVGYNLSLARYQRNQIYICCMLELQNGTDNWMTERDFSWTFYHYDGSTLTKGVEMKDHQVGRCVDFDFVVDSHTYSMVSSYGLDSQNCSELEFYYMQNRFAEIDVNKLTRSELLAKLNSIPAASSDITVTVNGRKIYWRDMPFIDNNGRTMIPLRAIAEEMGLRVGWDSANRTAVFFSGRKIIRFPIDSKTAYTTEGSIRMDTAAVIVNDRTYAPVRYLAEYFGWTVGWDAISKTVSLVS